MSTKYCLQVRLISLDSDLLDVAEDKVRAVIASKIWWDEYDVRRDEEPVTGGPNLPRLVVNVKFNQDADMRVVRDWLATKWDVVEADLLGVSYIDYHLCNHDNSVNEGCPKPTRLREKL